MSDELENLAEPETPQDPGGPVCGERLAQARREQQISVLEVAKELHIDEAKVRALERNEFGVLGAAVFAKGHLRKYAQLVGVSQDDVLTDYYKMTHTLELPPIVGSRPRVQREISPGPWIALVIIVLVAAASYWWFVARPTAASVPAPVPEAVNTAQVEPEAAAPAQDPDAAAGETVAVAETPVVTEAPAAVPDQAPEGTLRLSLSYTGDCWTEITDAMGQRLFFGMGQAGRNASVEGAAPLDALFGNIENVSVMVDGRNYPLRPNTPGSRTARLTIVEP